MRLSRALAAIVAGLIVSGTAIAAEDRVRATECQSNLRKLNEAGVLRDLSFKPGTVVMVADRATWGQIDFGQKTRFVENVVCFITVGDKTKTARVEVRDHMENRVIGRYTGARLEIP